MDTQFAPEKEMTAAIKRFGMRHALRMTSLECLERRVLDPVNELRVRRPASTELPET